MLVSRPRREEASLFLLAFAAAGLLRGTAFRRLGLAFSLALGRLRSRCRGIAGYGFCLCLLRLARGQIRRGEALAIKGDLSDPDRGEGLPMAVNLLVLLFALEVEYQDLVGPSCFHHLPAYHGSGAGSNRAFLAGDRQNVIELHGIAVAGGQLLNIHYVSGSNAILF